MAYVVPGRVLLFMAAWLVAGAGWGSDWGGAFIQFNRKVAERTLAQWRAEVQRMESLGIRRVMVQWCAEERLLYFEDPELKADYPEQYPALDRLITAVVGTSCRLVIGLEQDPNYWMEITGKEQSVSDYFRVRVSRNERLQQALLAKYGLLSAWEGVYLAEEADDKSWRRPERRGVLKEYVRQMCARLHANDPKRRILQSAFFRVRTAPEGVAAVFRDVFDGSGLDVLLLQDGVGVGDPPLDYLRPYYESLRQGWPQTGPALWAVVEVFEQTSAPGSPFKARPASVTRVLQQRELASSFVKELVIFSYFPYLEAKGGLEAEALFQGLRAARSRP